MDDLKFLILYGVLAGVLFASYRKTFRDTKLDNIPRPWDTTCIPTEYSELRACFDGTTWCVAPRLTKDIASAPEHIISFNEGVEEVRDNLIIAPTILIRRADSPFKQNSPWVVTSRKIHTISRRVRTTLTRNLHACFPEVRDEIVCAFNDVLQLQGSEWKGLPVLPTMMAIVARASNRLFGGSPFM
ncbi:hypothetical protein B0H14DRAFT_3737874 [Mycena olivaceomarginata]|nr:hypothetical protein B0H14DRAFT_3737874 [Mycena olivaceomarginata]